ncbi:chloride channel protein [Taibaiella sp. KBW10]|uniref:chloride channel protein n=1 Tax=Taibaiella sp. KBW10 TaxID=2153357 RepID=UPI0018F78C3E|nr:chloride channel protein [Taibaiella sp. KBW10]
MRKKIITHHYFKLCLYALFIGLIATLLACSLKALTATYQDKIFEKVSHTAPLLYILLPSIGITLIYFLRKYAFKNKKNTGIREIYTTLETRKNYLPFFKIPSHYINGFLTVIFGGSTGIEVSTVVATATVGAVTHQHGKAAQVYKKELICAGVAAGITALFGNPLAGLLFAVEVISGKVSKPILISCGSAVLISGLTMYYLGTQPLLPFTVQQWHLQALPFIVILSILSALLAVYFTRIVILIKGLFSRISNNFIRVNMGAILVGGLIFLLPYLYGDSYRGLIELLHHTDKYSFTLGFGFMLLALVLLKPLAASLTLGAGGDGGVFAPGIVSGAFLGILFASACNYYLHTQLIVLNFALIGIAATLSAAIHAPLTALSLTCYLVQGGYLLFVPILIAAFVGKIVAQKLLPYTVYTYKASQPASVPLGRT